MNLLDQVADLVNCGLDNYPEAMKGLMNNLENSVTVFKLLLLQNNVLFKLKFRIHFYWPLRCLNKNKNVNILFH